MIQRINIDKSQPDSDLILKAVSMLEHGGLVIVPTETVYGVACDPVVSGAMEKLIKAKGRDGDKPIARLAADGDQVKASANNWTDGLEALATAYWPGPLTIVLETADGWTGYRVPDHPVAVALAKQCGRTLALTSANLSGEPDTKTAQEAMDSIEADLALDSGPSAAKAIPSTVIKVDGSQVECLREGQLSFSDVETVFKNGLE